MQVTGPQGPVMEGTASEFRFYNPDLRPVAFETFPANFSPGPHQVNLHASGLEGSVVLSWTSYSRAVPPGAYGTTANGTTDLGAGSFRYGNLPQTPVRFQAQAGTTLFFHANGSAEVALFDPQDKRIASLVMANATRAYEVPTTGDYVAVAYGEVELAADRAPSDFELHPLTVRTLKWREPMPGSSSPTGATYDQASQTFVPDGVLFDARPASDYAFFEPCLNGGWIRIWQDDVVAEWGGPVAKTRPLLLHGGEVTVESGGFGGTANCDPAAVAFFTYLRP